MANQLPQVAEDAARKELSFQQFFEHLLQAEDRECQEQSRTLLTRTAGFPSIKTLEQYDVSLATGASKQTFKELSTVAACSTAIASPASVAAATTGKHSVAASTSASRTIEESTSTQRG